MLGGVGGILRRKGASRRGVFIYIKTKFDKPAAAARGSVVTKNVPKREKKRFENRELKIV